MLDVHAPHKPLEGIRDFLLHLFTITVGLLIALGLEGLVEWRHHVHLVHETRETLRAEIEHNRDRLRSGAGQLQKERDELGKNLATIHSIQQHPSAPQKGSSLAADLSMVGLDDTAWNAAKISGALAYMPYAEAQRFTDVYDSQADLRKTEEAVMEDVARFEGLVHRYDVVDDAKITPEAAAAFAECLGTWSTHLTYFSLAGRLALAQDEALLDGRPAPTGLNERLR